MFRSILKPIIFFFIFFGGLFVMDRNGTISITLNNHSNYFSIGYFCLSFIGLFLVYELLLIFFQFVVNLIKNDVLLSNHSFDCQSCPKNGQCELLEVSRIVGARPEMYKGAKTETTYDDLAYGIIRDTSKCILCGRCIETCKDLQGLGILGFEKRGFKTIVGPSENRSAHARRRHHLL